MLSTLDVNFHGKRHTDFDLSRVLKAKAQGFDRSTTAYLCGVSIKARTGINKRPRWQLERKVTSLWLWPLVARSMHGPISKKMDRLPRKPALDLMISTSHFLFIKKVFN